MKHTSIEWTDCTFNPWIGRTKVSEGCKNCYAESQNKRFKGGNWGKGAERRRTSLSNWKQPLRWNKEAEARRIRDLHAIPAGVPHNFIRPRVFCASMADWLDNEVPIEWLADLLDLIQQTPNLDWLLLTKRPENFFDRLGEASSWCDLNGKQEVASWINWWTDTTTGGPPANVWIGTTVENQEQADARIPELLKIPAPVRFLSCEPLLGPINLGMVTAPCGEPFNCLDGIGGPNVNWVITGGESGPNARPMHPDWARSLRDQCAAAGVPFFFKQWGEFVECDVENCESQTHRFVEFDGGDSTEWTIDRHTKTTAHMVRVGKKFAGRLLDGVEHNGVPEGGNA